MPLSEHEQRMLEQMERALYAEDPKFASALEGRGLRTYTRRRVYLAVAGFLVGVGLLMAGVIAVRFLVVSIVGFLVMLGCALLGITGWRRMVHPESPPGAGGRPQRQRHPRRRGGSMMDRIEARWQRRRDERG